MNKWQRIKRFYDVDIIHLSLYLCSSTTIASVSLSLSQFPLALLHVATNPIEQEIGHIAVASNSLIERYNWFIRKLLVECTKSIQGIILIDNIPRAATRSYTIFPCLCACAPFCIAQLLSGTTSISIATKKIISHNWRTCNLSTCQTTTTKQHVCALRIYEDVWRTCLRVQRGDTEFRGL